MILYSFALASAASEPKDTRGSRGRAMGIHSLLSTSFLSPIGQALHSALRILGYQLCLKSSLSEPSSHRLPLVPLLRPLDQGGRISFILFSFLSSRKLNGWIHSWGPIS